MPTASLRRWTSLATALFLLPAAQAATAQEGAKRQIEEVIVTAERREASIQDTSISITAFTSEFLDDFGIRNQEDLQNFVPATTIQPYDATVRGVGRNFRALGGDPGVATYMNGVYSEDLLTATAATFFDVERIEVLRGPQGTLYGRNAVGGAINILYNKPSYEFESVLKGIVGSEGTAEYYAALSGPIIQDKLAGRLTFSYRDRDGVIDEIGPGRDLDGLGTENIALQLQWNPTETIEVAVRQNFMDIDRPFGGANGGGLVVLNEDGTPSRNTTDLVPGYRFVDPAQTSVLLSDYVDPSQPILTFTDPLTGAVRQAQRNRLGIDYVDADGYQNAAASLTGFGFTSPEDAARYNACVFSGDIDGDDICAATNGLNREEFRQKGTQFSTTWDASERLQLKYIFGYNELIYERTTDDDNTASQFHDRQFYVNHEAEYKSHEFQAFFDVTENVSVTSGIFFYDAVIDQRGDLYSSVGERRMIDGFPDGTALNALGALILGVPAGIPLSALLAAPGPNVHLYSAKYNCTMATGTPAETCQRNYSVENQLDSPDLLAAGARNDNLVLGLWAGDNGTNPSLDVKHGPNTLGSDVLYATRTDRKAFAAYTQGVWDINEKFTLTLGIRYAEDEVKAEENLFRYTESDLQGLIGLTDRVAAGCNDRSIFDYDCSAVAAINLASGTLIDNGDGTYTALPNASNGGLPVAVSVYRPFERTDRKWTGRINLDWNINDNAMMYFSTTSGYRSGGYNLLFFSRQASYDPEELIAYEIGYKTQWLDNSLQVNGSVYYYDYETIHTVGQEVSTIGGLTNSVLEAPGAEIYGIEGEIIWLATDNLTLGGNFSFTPSEYTEDLFVADPSRANVPASLFPTASELEENIKGNQVLQVPEGKFTTYGSYVFNFGQRGNVELFATYSWIDKVYYSPFERDEESAESYDRIDLRSTWTSADNAWQVSGFVNNVLDDVGVLQVLREDETEFFRHTAGTTVPRLFGLEVTYNIGAAR